MSGKLSTVTFSIVEGSGLTSARPFTGMNLSGQADLDVGGGFYSPRVVLTS